MAVLGNGTSSVLALPPPALHSSDHRQLHFAPPILRSRIISGNTKVLVKSSHFRIRTFQHDGVNGSDATNSEVTPEDQNRVSDNAVGSNNKNAGGGSSFLSNLGILLGVAAVVTLVLVGIKPPNLGTSAGIQFLQDGAASTLVSPTAAFSFRAFGYTVVLPEYAPGWIYFWLLMAAGCGLFISEEALNIWVGVTLARLLTLDGTWQSLVASFSRNAPYILSTVLWVYWGVCISDMIPFYLGKIFRQSRASDDIRSKLGVGEEKAKEITRTVHRYGNLIGFVERFSLGVRNPTAFLAGAMVRCITRVFLCRCLLWWTGNSSIAVGNWILAKRTSSLCARNCCHRSGNLDCVSICFGCSHSTTPLSAKALLKLATLIFCFACTFWGYTDNNQTMLMAGLYHQSTE